MNNIFKNKTEKIIYYIIFILSFGYIDKHLYYLQKNDKEMYTKYYFYTLYIAIFVEIIILISLLYFIKK